MDVFDAVRTLLAIRRYRPELIPAVVVQRIVESGHLTASSQNGQPWHFIVIEDRDSLRRMGQALRTGPYVADASLAIVVAIDRSNRFGVSDGSRAIQSMMLTAWEAGIGSNWVGFAGGLTEIKTMLEIPDTHDVLAVLPFGYPVDKVGRGRKQRKPLGEVASRERFGAPFQ